MGKLNILHHKEWHVYSHDNRNKVIKDEQKAQKIANLEEAKRLEIEAEKRLSRLHSNSTVSKKQKHINLFEDAEKYHGSELVESDAKIAQRKKEERFISYLGRITEEKNATAWYSEGLCSNPDRKFGQGKLNKDRVRKEREDPMNIIPKSDYCQPILKCKIDNPLSMEDMRRKRLEREKSERERLSLLLNSSKTQHETSVSYYHSQYNRSHVRKRENR